MRLPALLTFRLPYLERILGVHLHRSRKGKRSMVLQHLTLHSGSPVDGVMGGTVNPWILSAIADAF